MRTFSLSPNSKIDNIEQYCNFLTREVYYHMQNFDINDPLFLQQLGIIQSEGIRRAINENSAIFYDGIQETNVNIANTANHFGKKIESVTNLLTSSLNNGFTTLNNSLIKIDSGIDTANVYLSNIDAGVESVNNNLRVLGNLVGQGLSILNNQLSKSNLLLKDILRELKIPETQRERRYHIEEGTKYLTLAFQTGDNAYFNDAFDEFNKALTFERKDWYSWFNIGLIHLRSVSHVDTEMAIAAFKETMHYGMAEAIYSKNKNLEYKLDEAHLYMAEAYYLKQDFKNAVSETDVCLYRKDKANFMKVKYLSAIKDSINKKEAAKILSALIDKNPYVSLEVLKDNDIIENEYVISLLEEYQKNALQKARIMLRECDQKNMIPESIVKYKVEEINQLIQKGTYLDVVEAISLLKENVIRNKSLVFPNGFSGYIKDFILIEKQKIHEIDNKWWKAHVTDTILPKIEKSDYYGWNEELKTHEWWEVMTTIDADYFFYEIKKMLKDNSLPQDVIRNCYDFFVPINLNSKNNRPYFGMRDDVDYIFVHNNNTPEDILIKISEKNIIYEYREENSTVNNSDYYLNLAIVAHRNTTIDTLWKFAKNKACLYEIYNNSNSTVELKNYILTIVDRNYRYFLKDGRYRDNNCYIATACYGSVYANEVDRFREYRDKYLVNSIFGRIFIALYYLTSPPIAKIISKHEWMKKIVREYLLVPILQRLPQDEHSQ